MMRRLINFIRRFVEERNTDDQILYEDRCFLSGFLRVITTYISIPFGIIFLLLTIYSFIVDINVAPSTYIKTISLSYSISIFNIITYFIPRFISLIYAKYFDIKFRKSILFVVLTAILHMFIFYNVEKYIIIPYDINPYMSFAIKKFIQFAMWTIHFFYYPKWCLRVYFDRNL